MALLVILTFGIAIGWLAAILLRQDTLGLSLANMGVGAAGAVVGYGLVGGNVVSNTVSPGLLLVAALGAVVLLGSLTLLRRQTAQ